MKPILDNQRRILSHALLAYLTALRTGTRKELEKHFTATLTTLLAHRQVQRLIGKWRVVWGPAIFQAKRSKVADNTMYVVKKADEPQYVIAIAGTNPISLYSWIKQDFSIRKMVPWPYECGSDAKISVGTDRALKDITEKMASKGTRIFQFLQELIASQQDPVRIAVTGHSLGGTLSSTLALALADTQQEWDPQNLATVSAYSVAGLTAGNAEFAQHSDDTLQDRVHRYWNTLDITAYGWNVDSMKQVPSLYEPSIKASWLVRLVIKRLSKQLAGNNYTQVRADQPGIPGKVIPMVLGLNTGGLLQTALMASKRPIWNFIKQVIYQHSIPYLWWLLAPPDSD